MVHEGEIFEALRLCALKWRASPFLMVMRRECGQGDPVVRGDDRGQALLGE